MNPSVNAPKESLSMIMPILFLIVIVFILGFYIPPFLNNVLQEGRGTFGRIKEFMELFNGGQISLSNIPTLAVEEFRDQILESLP